MVEKAIEIVGISKKGFSEAAQDAIANAAKTVREIKWALAEEFEVRVDNGKVSEYRTYMKIYFDVEGRE